MMLPTIIFCVATIALGLAAMAFVILYGSRS